MNRRFFAHGLHFLPSGAFLAQGLTKDSRLAAYHCATSAPTQKVWRSGRPRRRKVTKNCAFRVMDHCANFFGDVGAVVCVAIGLDISAQIVGAMRRTRSDGLY